MPRRGGVAIASRTRRDSADTPRMTDSTAPLPTPTPVPVRYRAGEVGETRRVVHTATWTPAWCYRAVCGEEIDVHRAEVVAAGMPCVACVRALALRDGGRSPE